MKKTAAIVVALLIANPTLGQEMHLVGPSWHSMQPVSPATMNSRIERAATEYRQYAPIPRVGLYDIAYPANATEYNLMDGYAVMLVTVLSQRADELPPKRVFLKVRSKTVELRLISSVFFDGDPGKAVAEVFGRNRWDGLYLLPAYLRREAQGIMMDFARNRDGFQIGRFPEQDPEEVKDVPVTKPAVGRPNADALARLVAREFPGFIMKPPAHKSSSQPRPEH